MLCWREGSRVAVAAPADRRGERIANPANATPAKMRRILNAESAFIFWRPKGAQRERNADQPIYQGSGSESSPGPIFLHQPWDY